MRLSFSLSILCGLVLITSCSDETGLAREPEVSTPVALEGIAQYVGAEACKSCHQDAWIAWRGSHHDLALQQPNDASVLAEFEGSHDNVKFASVESKYTITPDPESPPLPVRFTFGVAPLQQYIVETERGRLQTFPTPWDTRSVEEGGQRWYALYPGEYPPDDPMHWQGRANNWNSMCADCHSTAVEKRYDPATRSYDTRFEEEDVACEACHGPGSKHIANPQQHVLANLSGQAGQLNTCARCHSRRSQLAEGFTPEDSYLDFYSPALLRPGLYHLDGQIQDEVYVYGSFLQSKMHQKGVQCSDCHEPHTTALKLPGNQTCSQCHQLTPRAEFPTVQPKNYDDPSHHFHQPGTPGAQCVSCHMTSVTYMGVDDRRDHSFRIPRPDLSDALEVPNACTGCHTDRSNTWASDVINKHYASEPSAHFATVFAQALNGELSAEAGLAALATSGEQPIMIRATALARLAGYNRGYTLDAVRAGRNGPPLLRLAAPRGAVGLSPQAQWRLISPLLDDELRAVRDGAFVALLPLASVDTAYQSRLRRYLPTYLEGHALNLDFPETLTNIANAHRTFGNLAEAESALSEALQIQPTWVPAMLNLADLYRATGRDGDGGDLIYRALQVAPESPNPAFSYALWLSRQARASEALIFFNQAAIIAPNEQRFGYALALALNDSGDGSTAVTQLKSMLAKWPANQELLRAVVTMLRDQQRFPEALHYLEELIRLRPADEELHKFREALAATVGRS